jgi:hypothetical protein
MKASPPTTWNEERGEDRINASKTSREYDEEEKFFLSALYTQRDKITVKKVKRIQNIYPCASRTQSRNKPRRQETAKTLRSELTAKTEAIERRWLFDEAQPDAIPNIEKQEFNRAFAGHHAVAYGRGVYFANDASYSSHETYFVPDDDDVQYIFLCRVAVGDWCKGRQQRSVDAERQTPQQP